jgi:hypothetical protein
MTRGSLVTVRRAPLARGRLFGLGFELEQPAEVRGSRESVHTVLAGDGNLASVRVGHRPPLRIRAEADAVLSSIKQY